MHPILADDIDGGIFALLVLGAGLITSVFALIGLVPALRGDKPATLYMIAPAFLCGAAIVVWLTWQFIDYSRKNPHARFNKDQALVFIVLAGPPLATSLVTGFVLWMKRRKLAATTPPKA